MKERFLGGHDVRRVAVPDFQGWLLDSAAKRECESPGQSRFESAVHSFEAGGGLRTGLAAGKESDSGYGRGNGPEEAIDGGVGHFVHGVLLGTVRPR
jgi:hypothetical protein